ncbi:MAG: hypothetical protein U0521_29755 [Anaerolineae bacterium]
MGTFLQNPRYERVLSGRLHRNRDGRDLPVVGDEAFRPKRHLQNEIVNLYGVLFDVGILHYASDTPFTKGKNLGTNLSYAGVDPTYATSIAILHRILSNEAARQRRASETVRPDTRGD